MTALDRPADTLPAATSERRRDRVPIPAFVVALLAFIVSNAFSGQKFGLPLPVSPDRIVFAGFLLLLVTDRRIRWRTWRIQPAVWVAAAAFLAAAVSANYHGTLKTRFGAFALLDRLAIPYLLFAVAPVVLATRRSRVLLLQVLTVLGIYLGATAVFEIFGPHALIFPGYIGSRGFGIGYGRARGPLGASDADAAVMAACMFAAFATRAVCTRPAWRLASVVSVVLCLTGIFLALTRAEWIGTAVALLVTGLLVPGVRLKLPAAFLALAAVITVALVFSPTLRNDATTRTQALGSVYDRANTDAAGVRALQSDPLFGIGWTLFLPESDRFVRQNRDYPLNHTHIEIHNVPLSRLAELGLLGGGLWILSVLFGPVAAMFSRRRRERVDEAYRVAFIGTMIVWLVAIQFSPFPYPLPNALVWLLAGLVLSPLGRDARTRPRPGGPDPATTTEPQPGAPASDEPAMLTSIPEPRDAAPASASDAGTAVPAMTEPSWTSAPEADAADAPAPGSVDAPADAAGGPRHSTARRPVATTAPALVAARRWIASRASRR